MGRLADRPGGRSETDRDIVIKENQEGEQAPDRVCDE